MRSKLCRAFGLILVFFLGSALLTATPVYHIIDIGLLPDGTSSSAAGISANGYVAGSGDTTGASSRALFWSPGGGISAVGNSAFSFGTGVNATGLVVGYAFASDFSSYRAFAGATVIPTLGGASNAATGVNDSGVVVGYSDTAGGNEEAFRYSGGTSSPLGYLPGGDASRANAINSSGVIAGRSNVSAGSFDYHAGLWQLGAWTDLGVPNGFQWTEATGVADAGQVAGTANDGLGGTTAFLWTHSGGITLLGALNTGGTSKAFGVNSSGLLVGTSDGAAFLYDGSMMRDLNSLLVGGSGWQLSEADAINNAGQIVGMGYYNGQQHGFLLQPVPEPSTFGLLACGLLATGTWRRFCAKGRRIV